MVIGYLFLVVFGLGLSFKILLSCSLFLFNSFDGLLVVTIVKIFKFCLIVIHLKPLCCWGEFMTFTVMTEHWKRVKLYTEAKHGNDAFNEQNGL